MRSRALIALFLPLLAVTLARAQTSLPATRPAGPALQPDSQGWIVLFRADNPDLWNSDAGTRLQATGYAAALARLPGEIQFLRMKRMDTGEVIIVQATRDALLNSAVIPANLLLQTGKQTWEDAAGTHRLLGIGAYGMLAAKGEPYVWKTSSTSIETGYGGWGIGKVVGGAQSMTWGGQPIARTAIEIAVKAGELSTIEKKDLLTPGEVVVTAATWGKGAATADVLDIVKAKAIAGRLRFVADSAILGEGGGSKGRTLTVSATVNGKAMEQRVAEGRTLQIIAPPLRAGVAIAEGTGPRPKAVAAPPKVDAAGWMVLFRNDAPGLWNSDAGNPDLAKGFAGTMNEAPASVLYVRIKRMDSGETVIAPLNRKDLTSVVKIDGSLLWCGGEQSWSQAGKSEKFLGLADIVRTADKPGDLLLWSSKESPDQGLGGWGFGKAVGSAEPHTLWAGFDAPHAVLEIAVKEKPLTASERGDLLIPGRLEILQAKWGHGSAAADVANKLRGLIAEGVLDQTLTTTLLGDAASKDPSTLTLAYKLNGVAFNHTYKQGEKLLLVAPPVKASTAGPRGSIATHDEILNFLDAGLYADTLSGLDRTLALTGAAAAGIDRYEMLMLRAECLIQMKDRQRALTALEAAAKGVGEDRIPSSAIALAAILRRSVNGQYLSVETKKPVPMMDFRDRKAAFDALWADEKAAMARAVAGAQSAGLPAIIDAGRSLVVARAADYMSTGNSDEVQSARKGLAQRAAKLLHDELQKDADENEKIYAAANREIIDADTRRHIGRVGLTQAAQKQLGVIQNTCKQLVPLIVDLIGAFDDVGDFRELGKSAEKIGARAREIAGHNFV